MLRGRTRTVARLTLTAAFALVSIGLPATPAHAASCTEETIFIGEFSSQWAYHYGTRGDYKVQTRDFNPNCGNINLYGSTAHVRFNFALKDWAEAGWQAFPVGGLYNGFAEWGINNNPINRVAYNCSGWALPLQGHFRVDHTSGTSWDMSTDCNGGGTYHQMGLWNGSGYTTGVPVVETWRVGGTATGMADTVVSLRHMNSSGNWGNWAGMACDLANTNASNWSGRSDSATSYSTYKTTSPPC